VNALAVILALAGAADDVDLNDTILQHYGSPAANVKIVEDTWKKVRGTRGRGAITIHANDVRDTEYGDAWGGFNRAKVDAQQGRYTRAIRAFDKFVGKAKEKPWSLQYSLYYGGFARLQRADRGAGDLAGARKLFKRLTEELPDSRFVFEAYLGIGDSYFGEQNWDEVERAYKLASQKLDEASRATTSKRALSEYYGRKRWLAETKIAESFEARRKWTLAKIRYSEIAASAAKYGDVSAMAKSGKGRCMVAAKEYGRAVGFFEKMIEAAEAARQFDVLGGAYCGLGDAYFGKKEYLRAMWNYKRVTVMYFTEPQYAAKAHFRAGRCYEYLEAKEKYALKFARRHYNRVVELYADSPWKDEAAARLEARGGAKPAD